MNTVVIDFGIGNIKSWERLFFRLRTPVTLGSSADLIAEADKLILPGVGNFASCMDAFDSSGVRGAVESAVLERKVPILGICVGMQMLTRHSEEGDRVGLGWIAGRVRRLPNEANGQHLRVPHVGNNLLKQARGPLFDGIAPDTRFYFTHSYYVELEVPEQALARCDYGLEFAAAVNTANVYGCQFHPEKSHAAGQRVVQNFIERI